MFRCYHMFIIDREFNSRYFFDGIFATTAEALRFINENRAVGNTVRIWFVSFQDTTDPVIYSRA